MVGDEFMTEIDPSTKSGDNSLGRMKVFGFIFIIIIIVFFFVVCLCC